MINKINSSENKINSENNAEIISDNKKAYIVPEELKKKIQLFNKINADNYIKNKIYKLKKMKKSIEKDLKKIQTPKNERKIK